VIDMVDSEEKSMWSWKLTILLMIVPIGLLMLTELPNFIIDIVGEEFIGLIWFAYFFVVIYKLLS